MKTYIKTATHPTGLEIKFDPTDHSYIDSKSTTYNSVTTYIKGCFPEFDKVGIAKRMGLKSGRDPKEIITEWELEALKSTLHGRAVHEHIENRLKGIAQNIDLGLSKETILEANKAADRCLDLFEDIQCEKIIFSPDIRMAGTMDLFAKLKGRENEYVILDWKTNKRIDTENTYNKFGLGKFGKIPDLNFYHYSLQLSVYKAIVLSEGCVPLDSKISLLILHLPSTGGEYVRYSALDLSETIIKDLYKKKIA